MDFERFDKLARSDRVTLLTALELLWQNGRMMLQTEDESVLMAGYIASIGGFYTKEKLHEVMTTAKELASLETAELIRCLRCGSMKMKNQDADEEGVCPICGGELEYGNDKPLDDGGVYEWTCPDCGAIGKEGYSKVFDRHYDVHDGDGNPYPALPDSAKPIAVPETAEGPLSPCTPEVVVMAADRIYALSPADTAELNACFPRDDWGEYFWGFTCFPRQDYAKVEL